MPPGLDAPARAASLTGQIASGAIPDWLTPVPAQPGDVFHVYRVTPRAR